MKNNPNLTELENYLFVQSSSWLGDSESVQPLMAMVKDYLIAHEIESKSALRHPEEGSKAEEEIKNAASMKVATLLQMLVGSIVRTTLDAKKEDETLHDGDIIMRIMETA